MRTSLYQHFINFQKVFDSINNQLLLGILKLYVISDKVIIFKMPSNPRKIFDWTIPSNNRGDTKILTLSLSLSSRDCLGKQNILQQLDLHLEVTNITLWKPWLRRWHLHAFSLSLGLSTSDPNLETTAKQIALYINT